MNKKSQLSKTLLINVKQIGKLLKRRRKRLQKLLKKLDWLRLLQSRKLKELDKPLQPKRRESDKLPRQKRLDLQLKPRRQRKLRRPRKLDSLRWLKQAMMEDNTVWVLLTTSKTQVFHTQKLTTTVLTCITASISPRDWLVFTLKKRTTTLSHFVSQAHAGSD